ncbi:phosphatidylserine decarboxylase [Xylophilus rhododendri]|uniref:phosphatidylserine decarboxylase n=1 Tax=Xylophilus rhododendri TaxID=2697032 RepID=A0A857J8J6_9BURK|nr:archaetidylserine decarboxylase [Xylophilus rhododendri]QHJ00038.1 phosphatidylserine decarboxylase [Xylophilus rhododendri]
MKALQKILQQEDLNFLLTNRVPRLLLTRWMGWFSQIRNPLVCRVSIAVWRVFAQLDLSDAKRRDFASLHECFTRELKPGARPIVPDPDVLSSPCDAIVGACGAVEGRQVFQAKGFPYAMQDLFGASQDSRVFEDGVFITLRLTSSMYHRFHAPADCRVDHVTFIHGDTWNVNPIALARVERLFCRNERAVLRARTTRGGHPLAIVPVAAILVASLRLHFTDLLLHQRYRGPNEIPCDAAFTKGQEMGWFQHGSTIIVFAPRGFELCEGIAPGTQVRMGQALLKMPVSADDSVMAGSSTQAMLAVHEAQA